MRTIRTTENSCPWCDHPVDACTDPLGINSPSPGDVSICLYCSGLLQFGAGLQPEKLEEAVLETIKNQEPNFYGMLIEAQAAAKQLPKEGDRRE